jgi:hypothetical protein
VSNRVRVLPGLSTIVRPDNRHIVTFEATSGTSRRRSEDREIQTPIANKCLAGMPDTTVASVIAAGAVPEPPARGIDAVHIGHAIDLVDPACISRGPIKFRKLNDGGVAAARLHGKVIERSDDGQASRNWKLAGVLEPSSKIDGVARWLMPGAHSSWTAIRALCCRTTACGSGIPIKNIKETGTDRSRPKPDRSLSQQQAREDRH